jgi:16S rRNA (guanine(966)-N(2))-methyltransferase RsmD
VREALFMALGPVEGQRVVDLFAGSGALGIEALSRGAAHVDFVEHERHVRRVLEENLEALGLVGCSRVWALELPRGFRALRGVLARADLILADPPYGGTLARGVLEVLGREGVLGARARVVIEHHAKDEIRGPCGGLMQVRARRHGETVISTYQAAGPAAKERGR